MISAPGNELIYEDLAEIYERRRQPDQRDKFLVLAADAALTAGQHEHAERLRGRLLQLSPYHELRLHATFQAALRTKEIHGLVVDLRRQFPPQEAIRLAHGLRDTLSMDSPGSKQAGRKDETPPFAPLAPLQQRHVTPREASRQVRLPGEQSEHRWLIDMLIAVTALSGLALLGYTLLRPWLP